MKSLFLLSAVLVSGPLVDARAADTPAKVLVNRDKNGVALQGHDPVAYFTEKKPVQGDPKFHARHEGAVYWFASAGHQAMFAAAPEKYAPAFGGWCGYAVSIDRLSPVSPEWWQVIDGKLILQHNKKAWDKWNADLAANVAKAGANWPGLVARHGIAGGRSLVHVDKRGVALGGHDPVAYFQDGKPLKGDAQFEATFDGAFYHFASQDNRAEFERNPTKYAPAYGGFCGYAASIGKVRPANPELWSIVDGRLIVQHTPGAVELWNKDVAGHKSKADANWPGLVDRKAGQKKVIDPLYRLLGFIPIY
jgi:YHS domain-containing protein